MPSIFEGLGAEQVVDEVFLVVRERINEVIDAQQARWNDLDARRATRIGAEFDPVAVEPVPEDNFHVGSIPSFVQTDDRVVNYPMVVVTAGRTIPDAEDVQMDQFDVYQNAVSIHSFARANPVEGAEVAYRRAMRMAEAVHTVVRTDRALRSLLSGVSGPLLVDRSEPWYFPPEDGHGEDWVWLAVMHQYQVKNYSYTPEEV